MADKFMYNYIPNDDKQNDPFCKDTQLNKPTKKSI